MIENDKSCFCLHELSFGCLSYNYRLSDQVCYAVKSYIEGIKFLNYVALYN